MSFCSSTRNLNLLNPNYINMKKFYTFVSVFLFLFSNAQVGINTTEPEAALDINGNLAIREVPPLTVDDTYEMLVRNSRTNEVQSIPAQQAAESLSSTFAKAQLRSGVSLLDLNGFNGWRRVDFTPASVEFNPGNHFSAADDLYTVPSDGIYEITYEFILGTGVQLSLAILNDSSPRMGILKHTTNGYEVMDYREFGGASVGLKVLIDVLTVNILISNYTINSVYQLSAGDQLSFEVRPGTLSLGLLSSSFAHVVVKKISD